MSCPFPTPVRGLQFWKENVFQQNEMYIPKENVFIVYFVKVSNKHTVSEITHN